MIAALAEVADEPRARPTTLAVFGRSGAAGYTPVVTWTGAKAIALRSAMRLTSEGFAQHLGLATRTVAKWRARPGLAVSNTSAQILDVVWRGLDEAQRARFAQLLNEPGPEADTKDLRDQVAMLCTQVDRLTDLVACLTTALSGRGVRCDANRLERMQPAEPRGRPWPVD